MPVTAADEPRSWGSRFLADVWAVLPAYVTARIMVYLGWVLARAVDDYWTGGATASIREGLVTWDGAHYRDIGLIGYEHLPLESLRFFPLYPVFSRGVSLAFDGNQGFALVLVANVCALLLAVVVRRMVRAERDEAVADRAVWALMFFPGGFVLVWAYSEAMFLLLCVGALFAARRQRWLVAAVLAVGAGLTRPIGLLLAVPLAIEAFSGWRRDSSDAPGSSRGWEDRVARVMAAGAPAVGTMAYVLWVERAWGVLFLPYTVQSDLRGESVNPIVRIGQGIGHLVGGERFSAGLHIPFAIVFVALAVVAWRRLPRSYAAFGTITLVVSLSAANLNSLERYGLSAFPLAIAAAVWADTERRARLLFVSGAAGVMGLSALAWTGVYVP